MFRYQVCVLASYQLFARYPPGHGHNYSAVAVIGSRVLALVLSGSSILDRLVSSMLVTVGHVWLHVSRLGCSASSRPRHWSRSSAADTAHSSCHANFCLPRTGLSAYAVYFGSSLQARILVTSAVLGRPLHTACYPETSSLLLAHAVPRHIRRGSNHCQAQGLLFRIY